MLKIDKVLYAADFSRCSAQALPHAVDLARGFSAELHVFHALVPHFERLDVTDLASPTGEDLLRRLGEHARREMDELLAGADLEGIAVTRVQRRGHYAAPMILDYARNEDVDVIVLGTHGRRGAGRLLLGSVAEEALRLSRRPVLTVKELDEPRPPEAIERILVPIDFSEHSERALAYARALAAHYGAGLQLLHVVQQLTLPSFYLPGAPAVFPQDFSAIEVKAQEGLHTLMREPGPEVAFAGHVISAPPAMGIADFAAGHDSDLIVIATHGLTGLERLLTGSTAEGVTRMALCPVFTVKSFGKQILVD